MFLFNKSSKSVVLIFLEPMRQQLPQRGDHHLLQLRLRQIYLNVPELAQKLPASAARGRHEILLVRHHGDRSKLPFALADRLRVGGALRAHAHSETQIFNVATGVGGAICAQHGGSHLKLAVGTVGQFARSARRTQQALSGVI